MKAIVLRQGSQVMELVEMPEPGQPEQSQCLVRTLDVGVCGTDHLLLQGIEGSPPPGEDSLVVGHEGFFEVVSSGDEEQFSSGDLVVTSVRWPDPAPCALCAVSRPDLCLTDQWTEHGIRSRHGFMREFWLAETARLHRVPAAIRDVAVLIEPLSVVVKGMEMHGLRDPAIRIAQERVVILGAGTIGLMAAAACLIQGWPEVLVADRADWDSRSARIIAGLGAEYVHAADLRDADQVYRCAAGADLVIEAAGVPGSLRPALMAVRPNGAVLALGTGGTPMRDWTDWTRLSGSVVQENKYLMGSVNASPMHVTRAVEMLGLFVERWPDLLPELIRRFQPTDLTVALTPTGDRPIKSVITFE